MFALVDCNNFYVSCERLFRPDLQQHPVAVLSNNDGCIVARSEEVKSLGIKMGTPVFKVLSLIKKHNIKLFSSNYTLYGDISNRVMSTLENLSSEIEVYSIDEAFICLKNIPHQQWESYGIQIQKTIYQHIGIPVSVGLAPTKTLAKAANKMAKKNKQKVCSIYNNTTHSLNQINLTDVWGIGAGYFKILNAYGVQTPIQFINLNPFVVHKLLGSKGALVHQELCGIQCLNLDNTPHTPQSVCYSRTLAKSICEEQLSSILALFSEKIALKLRKRRCKAKVIRVFLKTSSYTQHHTVYVSQQRTLLHPSNDSRAIFICAQKILAHVEFREWKKIGLMALDLSYTEQHSLFPQEHNSKIMNIMDTINTKMGAKTIQLAASLQATNTKSSWKNQAYKSPRYTTQWSELPLVHI
ncbi:MAG: hypothetical protein CMK59_06765 [Proteobacteria bacterium]|nr:hypothetical protein [Pseudomonadota bacterium]